MSNEKMAEVYFHIKTNQIGVGESHWDSSGVSAINIVATGSATSFEVIFEGKVGDTWSPVIGVRLDNLAICGKMDSKEVIYQIELTALKRFRCRLSSISGGEITVYGYAVK